MRTKMWLICLGASLGLACSDDSSTGQGPNGGENNQNNTTQTNNGTGTGTSGPNNGTSNNGTNAGSNTGTSPFEMNEQGQVLCGDVACECSDGIDNDGDGVTDGFDAECTGPYDNDEGSFATGIPGDNVDPVWQDCFFDGNSGHGDDGCRYKTDCLTGDLPPDDPDCTVSQRCIDFCRPYTPNGCDCFGCCEVYPADGSGPLFVVTGSNCSLSDIESCQTCEQTEQCINTCGECELCGGKTVADLPASCYEDPNNTNNNPNPGTNNNTPGPNNPDPDPNDPPYTCDDGEQVCSSTIPCAASNEYCSQGCCVVIFN